MSGLIKRTEKLSKAFAEGAQAGKAGALITTNPHVAGSPEEAAWDEGFGAEASTTHAAWVTLTAYTIGTLVNNDTTPVKVYECVVAGTSGATGPVGRDELFVDATVTWRFVGDVGPLVVDIGGAAINIPDGMVFGRSWKAA